MSFINKYIQSSIVLLFSLLFLSACKIPKINVNLIGSKISEQKLLVLQTNEVNGGVIPEKIIAGVYTCSFRHESVGKDECSHLENFNFDSANGSFTFIPSYQQEGLFYFDIINPAGVRSTIIIEVRKKNEPPVISNIEIPESMKENNNYSISYETDDINLDQVVASLVCLSSNCSKLKNLTINQLNKTIIFNADFASSGSYSLRLIANDGELTDSEVINFSIDNVNRAPVLASVGNKSVAEGATLEFSLSGTDPDGDDLAYACSADCPAGLSVNSVTGLVSWTPGYDSLSSYSMTFSVEDNANPVLSDSETITISVTNINQVPVLASIGNQTATEGSELSFSISGIDLDLDLLSYSCSANCPTGLSVNASTGEVTWTPGYDSLSSYNVSFSVSDGVSSDTETITISVNNTNRAPSLAALTDITIEEDEQLTFDLVGTDQDLNNITYSCEDGCPTGMSIVLNKVSWKPGFTQSGTYNLVFVATDDGLPSYSDSQSMTIAVSDVNLAPVLGEVLNYTINEGQDLSFDLVGTDGDADDVLKYTCDEGCPTGMTITDSVVSWTPSYTQSGEYEVEFVVTDNRTPNKSDSRISVFTITNVNQAPAFNLIENQLAVENNELTFSISAVDPDVGDTLAYSCYSGCPAGLVINESTGAVSWTPGYDSEDSYSVTFRVTDNGSSPLVDSETITISINNTNRPPVLSSIGNKSVSENSELTFSLSATDPDTHSIAYQCSANCPAGLSVDSESGAVTWTPGYDSLSSYSVTFRAVDNGAPALDDTETITISVGNTNREPSITIPLAQNTINNGVSTNFEVSGTDPDGDTLTYTCTDCPDFFNFTDNRAYFTTDGYDVGTYDMVFRVKDDGVPSLYAEVSYRLIVSYLNIAPTLESISNKTVDENEELAFTLSADGLNPDETITYTCASSCPTGLTVNSSTGAVSWIPTYTQSGTYTVTFRATDNGTPARYAQQTATITVDDANRAPVLDSIANLEIREMNQININADDGGNDFDFDNQAITYSCYYDNVINGVVALTNLCTSITGLTFGSTDGVLSWRPALGSNGDYEFRIIGSDGSLSDSSIFNIKILESHPIILTFRTTATEKNITLPVASYISGYNYSVDWGDGSSLETKTNNSVTTHTYADADDYIVKIHGKFPAIYGESGSTQALKDGYKNRLVKVNSLGKTGLINLENAFVGCKFLEEFTVGNGDTSNVVTMRLMFSQTAGVNPNLTGLNTSNVTTMVGMFNSSSFSSLDISGFDASKVVNMESMFNGTTNLKSITFGEINTSSLTDMTDMFSNSGIEHLDLREFDTHNVTKMYGLFRGNSSLLSLNLSGWNTSNVTTMQFMFSSVRSLVNLDLSSFDTSNVTTMSYMFGGMRKLKTLNISSLRTGKVTDMSSMFEFCNDLESLDLSYFNTAKVTKMNRMFLNLTKITSLNLSSFNTSNVTTMETMFVQSAFTSLDLRSFDTSKVTNMKDMFLNSSPLLSLYLTSFNVSSVTNGTNFFGGGVSPSRKTYCTQNDFFTSHSITCLNSNGAALDYIADQSVNENVAISSININDDGDDFDTDLLPLTYSCEYGIGIGGTIPVGVSCSSLSGFNFDSSTGEISWTPSFFQSSLYEFKVTGSNGTLSHSRLFTINVTNVNRAPVFANNHLPFNVSGNEGSAISFTLDASDADGDIIIYTCTTSCPAGLEISGDTVTWTPGYSDSGLHIVTFNASDSIASVDRAVRITVTNTNRAPVFSNPLTSYELEGSSVFSFTLNAPDADGDNVTYSCVSGCPSFYTITGNKPKFDIEHEDVGVYEMVFRAQDDGTPSLYAEYTFTLTAVYGNDAPMIPTNSTASVDEMEELTINLGVIDNNIGETHLFSCSANCPAGLIVNEETGVVKWTPSYEDAGVHEVTFRVTDNGTPQKYGERKITITVNNVSASPILSSVGNQEIEEGDSIATININDGGDDFDGDGVPLTYACSYTKTLDEIESSSENCSGLGGVDFGVNDGVLDWAATFGDVGLYKFTVTASNSSLTDTVNFTINVLKSYPLKLVFRTTEANQTIALPVAIEFSYNYKVDWNDGSPVEAVGNNVLKTHTYAYPGVYEVKIKGTFTAIRSKYYSHSTWNSQFTNHLVHVSDLGRTGLVSLKEAFSYAQNLETFTNGDGDTSLVTTIESMFEYTTKIVNTSFVGFSTSNVTNMRNAFYYNTSLTYLDLSGFDTSNVTRMDRMFYGANALTTIDMSNFDTSNVTDMSEMFRSASSLTYLDVSSFRTESVLDTFYMFGSLNKLEILDISNFNLPNVTRIAGMFSGMSKVKNLDVSGINTSNINSLVGLFSNCSDLISIDVRHFDTSKVTAFASMFFGTSTLATIDVSNFDTSSATNMFGLFAQTGLTTLDISNFDTSNVINMDSMFSGSVDLEEIIFPTVFDTSKVTTMSGMFGNLNSLIELELPDTFNTAAVYDMTGMFAGLHSLTSLVLPPLFITANVEKMSYMFNDNKVASLTLPTSFDTSKVTDMGYMFAKMTNLTSLSFPPSFVTTNVEHMHNMFNQTSSITSLDLSTFNTTKVTNMSQLFWRASSLSSINFGTQFYTSNVTSMYGMFYELSNMTILTLPNTFDTSKVLSMSWMFYGMFSLSSLNLSSGFDTSLLTSHDNMFGGIPGSATFYCNSTPVIASHSRTCQPIP